MRHFPALLFLLALWSCTTDTPDNTKEMAPPPKADSQAVVPAEPAALGFDSTAYTYEDGAIVLTWKMLSDVVFNDEYSEEVQAYVPYPTFGASLRAIEGKEVAIEGYIIPLEETGDETILVLSAQPYSSCFFCGGAGPESVMDIKLRPGIDQQFTTDDRVKFRGKLRLNDDDLYYLNYILEKAEPMR